MKLFHMSVDLHWKDQNINILATQELHFLWMFLLEKQATYH